MPLQLSCFRTASSALRKQSHVLFVLPAAKDLPAELAERDFWRAVMKRREVAMADLSKTPLAADVPQGGRAACLMIDAKASRFERLTVLRKGVMALLDEAPSSLAIVDL